MSEHNQYIKFMSDIIDSGLWGQLSPASKTLYPVLLKFSNQDFKPVWPSTKKLLELTGFKTKKSIIQAKKELSDCGLLHVAQGGGRESTTYYFSFNYPGSKITPLGDKSIHRRDTLEYTAGVQHGSPQQAPDGHPNNINITITNTQNEKTVQPSEPLTVEGLIEDYGIEHFQYAYQAAKRKNLEKNLPYIKAICRNRISQNTENVIKNGHSGRPSWNSFLAWAELNLTERTVRNLGDLNIQTDGNTIFIEDSVNDLMKNIIVKYFTEEASPPVLVLFSESSEPGRVKL